MKSDKKIIFKKTSKKITQLIKLALDFEKGLYYIDNMIRNKLKVKKSKIALDFVRYSGYIIWRIKWKDKKIMTIYGETLEIKNVTEGYTKEQVEQNIEQFTEDRNEALYELYEMKRETVAFNESGNKYGYENLLDDTNFFTPTDFTDTYNVKGFDDEQVVEILEGMI